MKSNYLIQLILEGSRECSLKKFDCCKRIRMELEIGYPEHFVLWITESLAHTNSSQQPFSKNSELLCSCALKIQSSCAPT